jgi:hypothetical protein
MPGQKRADEAGSIYHALNRGNARQARTKKGDGGGVFNLSCFGLISNFLTILVPFRYEPRSCPLACWSFRLDGQVRERFGAPRSWSGSLTISPASGEGFGGMG